MSSVSAKTVMSTWRLIRRFLPYLHPVRWQVVLAGGMMLLSPLVAVLLLWLMKYLIDEVFVAKNISVLPTIAAAYVILVATKMLIDFALTRVEAAITEQIDQNVRVDLYRHLISVSPGSLRKYSVGDLLSYLGNDAALVEILIYSGPVRVLFNALTGIYFICFLLVLSWQLTLCALGGGARGGGGADGGVWGWCSLLIVLPAITAESQAFAAQCAAARVAD